MELHFILWMLAWGELQEGSIFWIQLADERLRLLVNKGGCNDNYTVQETQNNRAKLTTVPVWQLFQCDNCQVGQMTRYEVAVKISTVIFEWYGSVSHGTKPIKKASSLRKGNLGFWMNLDWSRPNLGLVIRSIFLLFYSNKTP